MKKLMIGTLLTLGLLSTASAHKFDAGQLVIDHPYTRSTPPLTPVAGGFMTITNNGDKDDRLFAASTSFSKTAEIHTMTMGEKGVMKMQQLKDGIVIPAGKTVELKPGGFHIMFIGLEKQMIPEERHKGLLKFENAGDIEVKFVVEDITKDAEAEVMDHSKMDHGTAKEEMPDKKVDSKKDEHAHHH